MLVSQHSTMSLPGSLSSSNKFRSSPMQIQMLEDKITKFLNRKFRISKSYATKRTYESALKQFEKFLRISFNLDLIQLLQKIKESAELDSIEVLDDYYTYLSQCKRPGKDKLGYSAVSIKNYLKVAKEFLNGEGCKIYNEDVKQRFSLPRVVLVYQKGLTKEIINRLVRLANPKLTACILVACSSGMTSGIMLECNWNGIIICLRIFRIFIDFEFFPKKRAQRENIVDYFT